MIRNDRTHCAFVDIDLRLSPTFTPCLRKIGQNNFAQSEFVNRKNTQHQGNSHIYYRIRKRECGFCCWWFLFLLTQNESEIKCANCWASKRSMSRHHKAATPLLYMRGVKVMGLGALMHKHTHAHAHIESVHASSKCIERVWVNVSAVDATWDRRVLCVRFFPAFEWVASSFCIIVVTVADTLATHTHTHTSGSSRLDAPTPQRNSVYLAASRTLWIRRELYICSSLWDTKYFWLIKPEKEKIPTTHDSPSPHPQDSGHENYCVKFDPATFGAMTKFKWFQMFPVYAI